MQQQTTIKLKVTDINEHLLCVLCAGYLVDATTIIECLHSFCRSCIVQHLEAHKTCPRCDVLVHKTKPLLNLRPDRTLQTLVYKLVPGVFQNEKQKRRQFYASRPEAVPISGADSGDIEESHLMYTEDEKISLCLQHCDRLPSLKYTAGSRGTIKSSQEQKDKDKRYLLCPALVTIACLKKFVQQKFDLQKQFQVEIFHSDQALKDACTLMDVANIYCWKRTKPLNLHYIVFDKTQLSLELPDPSDVSIVAAQKKARKRGNKRAAGGKSPNGLVKSRSFKPPKPRVSKISRKKAGAKCERKKAQGNVNNVDMTNNGKHEIGDDTHGKSDITSNKKEADTSDNMIEIADSEKPKMDIVDNVSEDNSKPDHGENQNIESMDTEVEENVLNISSEQDCFGIVIDTVEEEDTRSVLGISNKTSDEDTSVKTDKKSAAESEDEQPLSIVKIKLKTSPARDSVSDTSDSAKPKGKRAGKSDKSKLSTRKSKSPKHEKKRSKKIKEYQIVVDCNDNGSDEKSLETIRNTNSGDSSKVESKQELVDLTQNEGSGKSVDCKDAKDNDNQDGLTTKDTEPQAVGDVVAESQTDEKTNGVAMGEPGDNSKSQSSCEDDGSKMEVSACASPVNDSQCPEVQLSPEEKVTETNDDLPSYKPPQTVVDGQDNGKDNKDMDTKVAHTDTSESDMAMDIDEKDQEEKKNSLMNQPDVVRSSVPIVECQCSKSVVPSRSPNWSDQRSGQCSETCEKNSCGASNCSDMAVDRASPVSGANSPPAQVTDTNTESLLPGMNSRDVNKQRLSPASSICSVGSSLPGQSDVTMEDNLSSPGSQTSTVDSNTPLVPGRNRKTSTRDKAKSINSIIKQIEERKSKMGDTGLKVSQLGGQTPEPKVSQIKSPVTPTPVVSHVAGNFNQSLRYSSPSPSKDVTPVHIPKTQSKRRNVSPAHTSPDATPMKRLKQLCNVFGDGSDVESPINRRNNANRPPSTGASLSPQMYYPQYPPRAPVRMGMDPRAMMQAVQMGQLHHLQQQQQAAQQKQAAQQQQAVQKQHVQQQQAVQQKQAVQKQQAVQQQQAAQKQQQKQHKLQHQLQQRNHHHGTTRQKPRNHGVLSGMSPVSPQSRDGRLPVMKPYSNKKPDLPPACPTIMHPQTRPIDGSANSAPLMNANKLQRPGTPLRPAHTGPNPYYMDYSSQNPLANGYDEPLELTTKKSRDRKAEEQQHPPRSPATFLKIPSLLKP